MKQKIINDIVDKFKDLKNPDYSFINSKNLIYEDILKDFRLLNFKVEIDTDLNYMLCEYYYLSKGKKLYSLLLSFVGLYALIIKRNRNNYQIVTKENYENSQEREILNILGKYKLIPLNKEILEERIDFTPNHEVDYDEPIIYNLLFCEDIPPWQ